MTTPHVAVIGAGSTGAAIAYDLALRGLRVTLLERFGPAAATTGHNGAQLHSGARYAVTDPPSARECIQENLVLRLIMPGLLELNDGLFIAVDEEQLAFRRTFLDACDGCGIPASEISPARALQMEPRLNPHLLAAIRIPDGVFDPYRFTLAFIASALNYGAELKTFTEVTALDAQRGILTARGLDAAHQVGCDAIVNAAGPWAPIITSMAGISLQMERSAGVLVSVADRLCNMVINILDLPGDADIIVPQRNTSLLGTTSWPVEDPDHIEIPPQHVVWILEKADTMIPGASRSPVRGVMAAARPLIKDPASQGRATTRSFRCFDHAAQGAPGFFSIVGGKTTTARLMAEQLCDMVCKYLDWEVPCRTHLEPLTSFRLAVA
jgi:glycerol-3-phosphate dehydrogenase